DPNYFGYKVLAVSYGGSLQLFGAKGVAARGRVKPAVQPPTCPTPPPPQQDHPTACAALTGNSWARLNATATAGQSALTLDRAVGRASGERGVVATQWWSHTRQR